MNPFSMRYCLFLKLPLTINIEAGKTDVKMCNDVLFYTKLARPRNINVRILMIYLDILYIYYPFSQNCDKKQKHAKSVTYVLIFTAKFTFINSNTFKIEGSMHNSLVTGISLYVFTACIIGQLIFAEIPHS